ncbi:DUF397 domain-containing protein [Streptomyces sp. NPDC008313]|uniref:DUF397 domain-containing protein n=1 Tax=Streptomyces sp. NPDC008313 TaxID=3364826 RepID=UPI0036E60B23
MPIKSWQKSTYCGEGESCVHVGGDATGDALYITESSDPRSVILTAAPAAFRTLVHVLKEARTRG